MTTTDGAPPSARDVSLMGRVARRYYLRNESKKQIAEALGISRFKVARLLDEARACGLVRIQIGPVEGQDMDLASTLEEGLALHHCVVVTDRTDGGPSEPAAARRVAQAAADLAADILSPGDVLGLPWSRTIHLMVDALTSLPAVDVVQLCGDQVVPGERASATEVATRAARLAGGPAHVFFAPLVVDDADAAAVFRRQSSVADALDQAARVTTAFVGVGAWAPGQSSIYDVVTDSERDEACAEGVVGEITGVFFDASGRTLATTLTPRIVAVDADTFAAVPEVIGVARGAEKAASTLAAVRGGLLTGLVVDRSLALALAEAAGLQQAP